MISVIVPMYNSSKTIISTLKGIIVQEGIDYELILVDDCSKDDSVTIARTFLEESNFKRYQIVELTENGGVAVARNVGIDLAKGNYLAFCDSDDVWLQNKLQQDIQELSDCDVVCSHFYKLRNGKRKMRKTKVGPITFFDLLLANYVPLSTVVVKKQLLYEYKFPEFRRRQDWMLWLSLSKEGHKIKGSDRVSMIYNGDQHGLSANKLSLVKDNYLVYRSHLDFSVLGSVFCMILFLFVHFSRR